MLFFSRVWILVIVSSVIVLVWLTLKEERKKEAETICGTCRRSVTLALLSSEVSGPVTHASTR